METTYTHGKKTIDFINKQMDKKGLSLIHILRAHETGRNLVCRLLLEKKKKKKIEKRIL